MIKRRISILLVIICSISLFAKETTNNQTIEFKSETITIPVSVEQINRIVLPSKITSKVVSKEKNLEVSISGNQAFVKFAPIVEITKIQMEAEKEAKTQKQEIKYKESTATEIYFLADDDTTYSFILVPSKMDAQTITITNAKQKKKELSLKETQTPFMNNMANIVKQTFSGKPLAGYETEDRNEEIATSDNVNIVLVAVHRGVKYDIYKLSLLNKTSKGVALEERNLMGIIDKPTYLVSIFYDNDIYEIPPKGFAQALIIVASEGNKK